MIRNRPTCFCMQNFCIYCDDSKSVFSPAIMNRSGRNCINPRGLRWHALLETLGALGPSIKMAPKKTDLFVRDTTLPKCHFSAADLREIWRQHVNRCGQHYLLSQSVVLITALYLIYTASKTSEFHTWLVAECDQHRIFTLRLTQSPCTLHWTSTFPLILQQ